VVEPVVLVDQKAHSRVEVSTDDALITALIVAAREKLEELTGRAFLTQTWEFRFDEFPWGDAPFVLRRPPLQSVTSITFVDEQGVVQTLAANLYQVDSESVPALIIPAVGETWPDIEDEAINPVVVTVVLGYLDADFPKQLELAIKQLVGHWYEQRESVEFAFGGQFSEIPMTVQYLIGSLRMPVIG